MNGNKLGEILLEADVLTKRQLKKALVLQEAGDKRRLGEILIEQGYITLEDLTEIMLSNGHPHEVEKISEASKPVELSQDKVLSTKFTLSLQTMITAAVGISSLIGMWYALQAEIQEAKELPKIDNIYNQEYPSKAPGYNWPQSYEQYKDQVGDLQSDMDEVLDLLDEYEDKIEELEKQVTELRIKVGK